MAFHPRHLYFKRKIVFLSNFFLSYKFFTLLSFKQKSSLDDFMSDDDNFHYIIYKGYIHKIPIEHSCKDTNEKEISNTKEKKLREK